METRQNSNKEKKSGMCGCDCKSFSFKEMFRMMKQMKKNKSEGTNCCSFQEIFSDEDETDTTRQ